MDGDSDREALGLTEGLPDAEADGLSDGEVEGLAERLAEGEIEGEAEDDAEGEIEGDAERLMLGEKELIEPSQMLWIWSAVRQVPLKMKTSSREPVKKAVSVPVELSHPTRT